MTKISREKMSKSRTGMFRTEEHRKNISIALTGRKRGPTSDEQKKKLSKANSGENNGMYGRKHSDESKRKMSEKQRNRLKR